MNSESGVVKLYEKIYTRIQDDAAKYFQDEVMVIGWV